MEIFYNKQAKPLLKYINCVISTKNLQNKKLQEILKRDFVLMKEGVFLKYYTFKKRRYSWIKSSKTNTENEWNVNEIVIFENNYCNKEIYFSEVMAFINLLIGKFINKKINQEMIFSVSFQALEFIVLDRKKFDFVYDEYDEKTNSAHIRIYGKRKIDEILTYQNKIDEYKTEAIIVMEIKNNETQ